MQTHLQAMAFNEHSQGTAATAGQGRGTQPAGLATQAGLAVLEACSQTNPRSTPAPIQQDGVRTAEGEHHGASSAFLTVTVMGSWGKSSLQQRCAFAAMLTHMLDAVHRVKLHQLAVHLFNAKRSDVK